MNTFALNRSPRRVHVMLYVLGLVFLYPLIQENSPALAFFSFLYLSPLHWWSGRVILALFSDEPLDERDKQVAKTGFAHAYWILVSSLLFSLGLGVFDGNLWGPLEQLNRYFLLNPENLLEFWTLLLVAAVLPACVVAWLEPDPIPVDVELIAKVVHESELSCHPTKGISS